MKKTTIKNALKVFAAGGVASLMTATAGVLVYLAIKIFCGIPYIEGYLAVLGFVLALVAVAAALAVIYTCGAWVVIKGKFSK
jgi:hypothetical protein